MAGFLIAAFFGVGYYLSPQNQLQKSDAIVAISGGETQSRAAEAIKLYKEGWAPALIFSGAALDPASPSNAAVMKQLAIGQGVPPDAIIVEEKSANTSQNAQRVAQIVQEQEIKQIILVTSPYHQRRASEAFKNALGPDVKILNHSTTDQTWRRSKWWDTRYSFELTMTELQKTLFQKIEAD